MIDLKHCAASQMIRDWHGRKAALVHADPPWSYHNGKVQGGAGGHYECMGTPDICIDLAQSRHIALENAYLAVWVAKGFYFDFVLYMRQVQEGLLIADRWEYLTKCVWHKGIEANGGAPARRDSRPGIGYHVRGDHEDLILFRRGKPKPSRQIPSDIWTTPRTKTHSEKPQPALQDLAQLVKPGSLVAELYAGASASMPRACHEVERDYTGCELDRTRWAKARARLSQGSLFHGFAV